MRNSNKQVSFIPAAVTSVIALTGAFMMLISSFAEPDPKRCISPVKYIAELPQTIETYDNSDDFIYSYPPEDNVKIPPEIPEVIPETVAIEDENYTEVPGAQLEEEYSTQNYERNTIPNIYDYVINKRIHTEGDINEETYDYLIEEIWKQQDFVLQKFAENEENQIIIAAFSEFNEKCVECSGEIIEDIENVYGFNYAFYRKYEEGDIRLLKDHIYIRDYIDAPAVALTHEFGHYVDMQLGDISKTEEFYDIYDKEAYTSPMDQYSKSTPQEYFAESYARYVADAGELYNSCPDTFYYIDKYLSIF